MYYKTGQLLQNGAVHHEPTNRLIEVTPWFSHFSFFRMSPERMEHLLQLVAPLITKKDTNCRNAIPADERLMLTLLYLASGNSQVSLSYLFRMGKKTVSRVVSETSKAIYLVLKDRYFSSPSGPQQWKKISKEFEEIWQFPHVIGAIDGKHIRIKALHRSGTNYHNYKGYFSLQLLAICDAKYKFIFADVGQYGSNNDCAVLSNSNIGKKVDQGTLHIPPDEKIPGIDVEMPYYLLGDEIFPLEPWLMQPYPGNQPEPGQVYNYRHSRSRLPIENSFGILVARWRILKHLSRQNQGMPFHLFWLVSLSTITCALPRIHCTHHVGSSMLLQTGVTSSPEIGGNINSRMAHSNLLLNLKGEGRSSTQRMFEKS